ncbi:MAG: FHA domain-containing protein [Clostridiales bacterium]|nr:FHA domain-containing protein [Clostridiales bacterium]
MLSPVHVPILPERIYRTGEDRYRFLYCPDEEHNMGAEMQQFFAWMLSEINYGDSMTVRYVYHVYWLIRNRSFSAKLIEECLDYREEEVPGITSYESFFAEADGGENPGARQQMDALDARGSRQADAPGAQGSRQADAPDARGSRQTNTPGARKNRWQAGGSRAAKRRADRSSIPGEGTASVPSGTELYNAGRRTDSDFARSDGRAGVRSRAASGVFRAVGMVLAIAATLTGVLTAAAGIYFLGRGMLPVYNRYWLGGVFLCILLGEMAWQLLRRRRGGCASDSAANNPGLADAGEKMENPDQRSAASGTFWDDRDCGAADFSRAEKQEAAGAVLPGDGEETVRLDLGRRGKRPALVSEESGEIVPLLHFPFYIGNDLGLNQLMICDRTVSREHAVIERGGRPGSYLIRDMHSTNGTWVGSVRLEETAAELKEGDSLRFAEHRYRFEMVEE